MKVRGLDSKEYVLDLLGKECTSVHNKSKLHILARKVIKEVFPSLRLVEELHLPGCKTSMYLDFFIPLMRIAIEVQGEQHYKFNSHFYKNKKDWLEAKTRDSTKKTWCENNDITLIEFQFNEQEEIWGNKLKNVFRTN